MSCKIKKAISFLIVISFLFEQTGFAQLAPVYFSPPSLLTPDKFRPVHLRSLSFNSADNSLQLLMDKGDAKDISEVVLRDSTRRLMDYFLIGLSLPNDAFWVNLRPDQESTIIDPYLEKTDIGKILLEADLNLKKDLAGATSSKTKEGKAYWDKMYQKAEELFPGQEVSLPTYTRPWIVPGEIIIRQSHNGAYVYKAALKVMLEQDYLKSNRPQFSDPRLKELNDYSSALIRQSIIPKLTVAVNSSRRYAQLRQVYYSLILSQWFKAAYANHGAATADQQSAGPSDRYIAKIDTKDLTGLISRERWSKTAYFNQYKQSFQKGEYNESETINTPYGQTIRQYTSGGIKLGAAALPAIQAIVTGRNAFSGTHLIALKVDADGGVSSIPPEEAKGKMYTFKSEGGAEIIMQPEEFAGIDMTPAQISEALSFRKTGSDLGILGESFGFDNTFYGDWNQSKWIAEDLKALLLRKAGEGDRSLLIYEIGLGEVLRETEQIIGMLAEVLASLEREKALQPKEWDIRIIALDVFDRAQGIAKLNDDFKSVMEEHNIHLKFAQATTLDLKTIESISAGKKGDYVLNRYTDYLNYLSKEFQFQFNKLYSQYSSDKSTILATYISIRNMLQTFIKPGGILIVEPVSRLTQFDMKDFQTPVLRIPGARVLSVNELDSNPTVPAGSFADQGTGIYRIDDPAAFRRAGIKGWLELMDGSSRPNDGGQIWDDISGGDAEEEKRVYTFKSQDNVSIQMTSDELKGLNFTVFEISQLFSLRRTGSDTGLFGLVYGFDRPSAHWDQKKWLTDDIRSLVLKKEHENDKTIVVYQIGIGSSPEETEDIIEMLVDVFAGLEKEQKLNPEEWIVQIKTMDISDRKQGIDALGYRYKSILKKYHFALTFSRLTTLDFASLERMSEGVKGDYIINRFGDYANRHAFDGTLSLGFLYNPDSPTYKKASVFGIYISLRNTLRTLAKKGTVLVVEPVVGKLFIGEKKRYPFLQVPGMSVLTANHFDPSLHLEELSFANQGTGIYEVDDVEALKNVKQWLESMEVDNSGNEAVGDGGQVSSSKLFESFRKAGLVDNANESVIADYSLKLERIAGRGNALSLGFMTKLLRVLSLKDPRLIKSLPELINFNSETSQEKLCGDILERLSLITRIAGPDILPMAFRLGTDVIFAYETFDQGSTFDFWINELEYPSDNVITQLNDMIDISQNENDYARQLRSQDLIEDQLKLAETINERFMNMSTAKEVFSLVSFLSVWDDIDFMKERLIDNKHLRMDIRLWAFNFYLAKSSRLGLNIDSELVKRFSDDAKDFLVKEIENNTASMMLKDQQVSIHARNYKLQTLLFAESLVLYNAHENMFIAAHAEVFHKLFVKIQEEAQLNDNEPRNADGIIFLFGSGLSDKTSSVLGTYSHEIMHYLASYFLPAGSISYQRNAMEEFLSDSAAFELYRILSGGEEVLLKQWIRDYNLDIEEYSDEIPALRALEGSHELARFLWRDFLREAESIPGEYPLSGLIRLIFEGGGESLNRTKEYSVEDINYHRFVGGLKEYLAKRGVTVDLQISEGEPEDDLRGLIPVIRVSRLEINPAVMEWQDGGLGVGDAQISSGSSARHAEFDALVAAENRKPKAYFEERLKHDFPGLLDTAAPATTDGGAGKSVLPSERDTIISELTKALEQEEIFWNTIPQIVTLLAKHNDLPEITREIQDLPDWFKKISEWNKGDILLFLARTEDPLATIRLIKGCFANGRNQTVFEEFVDATSLNDVRAAETILKSLAMGNGEAVSLQQENEINALLKEGISPWLAYAKTNRQSPLTPFLIGFYQDEAGKIIYLYGKREFSSKWIQDPMSALLGGTRDYSEVTNLLSTDYVKVDKPEYLRNEKLWQLLPGDIKNLFDSGQIMVTGKRNLYQEEGRSVISASDQGGGRQYFLLQYSRVRQSNEGRTGVVMYAENGEIKPLIITVDNREYVVELKGSGIAEGGFGSLQHRVPRGDVISGAATKEDAIQEYSRLMEEEHNYPEGPKIVGSILFSGDNNYDQGYIIRLTPSTVRASYSDNIAFPEMDNQENMRHVLRYYAGLLVESIFLDYPKIISPSSAHPENILIWGNGKAAFTDYSDQLLLNDNRYPLIQQGTLISVFLDSKAVLWNYMNVLNAVQGYNDKRDRHIFNLELKSKLKEKGIIIDISENDELDTVVQKTWEQVFAYRVYYAKKKNGYRASGMIGEIVSDFNYGIKNLNFVNLESKEAFIERYKQTYAGMEEVLSAMKNHLTGSQESVLIDTWAVFIKEGKVFELFLDRPKIERLFDKLDETTRRSIQDKKDDFNNFGMMFTGLSPAYFSSEMDILDNAYRSAPENEKEGIAKDREELKSRMNDLRKVVNSGPESMYGFLHNFENNVTNLLTFDFYNTPPGIARKTVDDAAIVSVSRSDGGMGTERNKVAGIDFRNLPVVSQPVPVVRPDARIPVQPAVPPADLDKEWDSIREMVQKGQIPSGKKIKEYVMSCCREKDITQELEKVLVCISDILRLEEDYVIPCEPGFIQLLAVLESAQSPQELQQALSAVSCGI